MSRIETDKLAALARYFGYTSFRPMQEDVIDNVLAGRDTLVIMPTGGGKSLCYQLPAVLLEGLTIVVSPLISLMKDQVDSLTESGVSATVLNSSISSSQSSQRIADLFRGRYDLLYLAPERLLMEGFMEIVRKLPVGLIAIDEAHCISEWGHDFRPEYRQLREVRRMFPGVPVIALTATATDQVQRDIVNQLDLTDGKVFKASFVRENLYYEVRQKQETYEQIRRYLRSRAGESGIIYCGSRKGAESLTTRLQRDGFKAESYHAGLPAKERDARQEAFIRDDTQIIVATIAFGMGIDKPNVRYVIHYDLPKNLEGYYQETGRAGRDGLRSECILFYSYGDRMKIEYFIGDKHPRHQAAARRQLQQVMAFAESTVCRHRLLAEYFDERYERPNCGMCDNCTNPTNQIDATVQAQKFLSAVRRTGERFGATYVIDVLLGSENAKVLMNRHSNLPVFGIGKDRPRREWIQLSRQLLAMGYMVQGDYNVLKLTRKSLDILLNGEKVFMKVMKKERSRAAVEPAGAVDEDLFLRLRRLRKRLADEHDVPPYVIFSDASLREMAGHRPTSTEAFRQISGVGDRKLEMYGELFIQEIVAHEEGAGR